MTARIFALALLAATALLSGCATTEPTTTDPNRVTSIPWNRPERWESQGALGSMLNMQQ